MDRQDRGGMVDGVGGLLGVKARERKLATTAPHVHVRTCMIADMYVRCRMTRVETYQKILLECLMFYAS